jgi:hypothetical protein
MKCNPTVTETRYGCYTVPQPCTNTNTAGQITVLSNEPSSRLQRECSISTDGGNFSQILLFRREYKKVSGEGGAWRGKFSGTGYSPQSNTSQNKTVTEDLTSARGNHKSARRIRIYSSVLDHENGINIFIRNVQLSPTTRRYKLHSYSEQLYLLIQNSQTKCNVI